MSEVPRADESDDDLAVLPEVVDMICFDSVHIQISFLHRAAWCWGPPPAVDNRVRCGLLEEQETQGRRGPAAQRCEQPGTPTGREAPSRGHGPGGVDEQ